MVFADFPLSGEDAAVAGKGNRQGNITMKSRVSGVSGGVLAAVLAAGFVFGGPTAGWAADDITEAASIARGGKLYDKWYKVVGQKAPTESHKLYPADKEYAKKANANWRCKECHGWDGLGKDGAYAKGKHFSGIKGINGMAGGDPAKVVALLKAPAHGFTDKLSDRDFTDLANFVTKGQVDMDKYIDRAAKTPKGDAAKGAAYYQTICAGCHGLKGLEPKEMPPLGSLMGNPWEIMHKVLYGQPGEQMPALLAIDRQVVTDILAHLTTLPKER